MNVTIFLRKRVSAEVIRIRILKSRPSPGLFTQSLSALFYILRRQSQREMRHKQEREWEEETDVATRSCKRQGTFSPSISRGVWPSQHLDCEGGHQSISFCCFKSNQICGTLFQQPSEINTAGNLQIHCTLYFSMYYAVLCPSLSQPEHIAFLQEIAQIHPVSAIHDGHFLESPYSKLPLFLF